MAVDNSQQTEFGSGTPSGSVSFQGKPLLSGSSLGQSVAAPVSVTRVTGAVVVVPEPANGNTATVSCPSSAGFGSINLWGGILAFNSTKTSFTVYLTNVSMGTSYTANYSIV